MGSNFFWWSVWPFVNSSTISTKCPSDTFFWWSVWPFVSSSTICHYQMSFWHIYVILNSVLPNVASIIAGRRPAICEFQKFSRRQIFPNSIQRGDPSTQKSKNQSYFLYLNMNSTCSQLLFEVSKLSVAQNFSIFTFFVKFWLNSFVVQNFQKMILSGPSNAWNNDVKKN